ncbi:uncharacterized protein [Macrobrachium rosenbergii]|uniref:uncharacterized protein n=1 Tax=Macrobrachium rosenbergii TaxID=79674 RepID=UPI0034D64E35
MGVVLEQDTDEGRQPLAFFTKKLSPAKQKYSTFNKELLAVHCAIQYFHHMLEGWQIVVQMDYQHIVQAFTKDGRLLVCAASALWSSLTTSLGTKIKHTAAYNLEANGMIEQFHNSLKAALTSKCQDGKELPWIL